VPPVVPRDKSLVRDAVGLTSDAPRGETNGCEDLAEEVEGQAQTTATLKKKKRVKENLPIQTSPPKRKRSKSVSQLQNLGRVSINSIFGLPVLFFVHTYNPQGILSVSDGSDAKEMSREVQKLRRSSTLKKSLGSIKKVAPSASRMLKESRVSDAFEELKEPPAEHFFENQDDGWLSGIQVLVQQISIRGLHYDASDRGSGHGHALSEVVSRTKGYVATYVQRSDDEVSTGPAEGEPSPSDVNWDI